MKIFETDNITDDECREVLFLQSQLKEWFDALDRIVLKRGLRDKLLTLEIFTVEEKSGNFLNEWQKRMHNTPRRIGN